MADHIFEPKTARALLRQPLDEDEVISRRGLQHRSHLRRRRRNQGQAEGNHIVDIRKDLLQYDALDTGMFLCRPGFGLRDSNPQTRRNCSLSDGMRQLGRERN